MNYQLSWNLCITFIYILIGSHSSHEVYLQKKYEINTLYNYTTRATVQKKKKKNQTNLIVVMVLFQTDTDFSHRLVLQSNYKQRFQRITYFVCVYSIFLYLTISGLYNVTILSLNSFFFTCSHLGFYLYFFPSAVPSLHSIIRHRFASWGATAPSSLTPRQHRIATACSTEETTSSSLSFPKIYLFAFSRRVIWWLS